MFDIYRYAYEVSPNITWTNVITTKRDKVLNYKYIYIPAY